MQLSGGKGYNVPATNKVQVLQRVAENGTTKGVVGGYLGKEEAAQEVRNTAFGMGR